MNWNDNTYVHRQPSPPPEHRRTGLSQRLLLLLALILLSAPYAYTEAQSALALHADAMTSTHGWVLLDIAFEEEENVDTTVLMPPPGSYVFAQDDYVLLRAYTQQNEPLAVHWSGPDTEPTHTLLLKLKEDRSIVVTPGNKAPETPGPEPASWIDVPDTQGVYAFLGGGTLYGWFAAKRDKDHGAGISYLTHADFPDTPLWRGAALDLEHIFTGSASDNHRSMFTPRTDPMRFQVDGPGSVRVHWPAETASWNLDCEMRYAFSGEDAIDMTFEVIPRAESFPLEYVVFMWASYHHRFLTPAIHFQGIEEEQPGWTRFGPSDEEDASNGGTIAHKNAPELPIENNVRNFNLHTLNHIVFDTPFYYGLLDPALPDEPVDRIAMTEPLQHKKGLLAYLMMFDKSEPIRFTLWNWGSPRRASAWDWQYVLLNPRKNVPRSYRARLQITPYENEEHLLHLFKHWKRGRELDAPTETQAWAGLTHYSGPSNIYLASSLVSEAASRANAAGEHVRAKQLYGRALRVEPGNPQHNVALAETLEALQEPERALEHYNKALVHTPEETYAAYRADLLLKRPEFSDRRAPFWRALHEQHADALLPARYLGTALYDTGAFEEARQVLEPLAALNPNDIQTLFHLGNTLLYCNDMEQGLKHLTTTVSENPDMDSMVSMAISRRARLAQHQEEFFLAERLYREALRISEEDLWPRVHLGETLEAQGETVEAQQVYQAVLMQQPESPYTAARFQDICERRDCSEYGETWHDCLDFWSELSHTYPEAVTPRLYWGRSLETEGRWEEAEALYTAMETQYPEHPEVLAALGLLKIRTDAFDVGKHYVDSALKQKADLATSIAQRLYTLATHLDTKHCDKAVQMYRLASTYAPHDLIHRMELGKAYKRCGASEAAIDIFKQILQEAPHAQSTAACLNTLFQELEQETEAEVFWRALAQAHPAAVIPLLYLGLTLAREERLKEARLAYEKGIALDPRHADLLLQLGILDIRRGAMDAGIERIREVIKTGGNNRVQEDLIALVESLERKGHYDQIISLANLFLELFPTDFRFLVLLGQAYEHEEDWPEALEVYQTVLMSNPESPETAERLHALLTKHMNTDTLRETWRQIVEKHPNAEIPTAYHQKVRRND